MHTENVLLETRFVWFFALGSLMAIHLKRDYQFLPLPPALPAPALAGPAARWQ